MVSAYIPKTVAWAMLPVMAVTSTGLHQFWLVGLTVWKHLNFTPSLFAFLE